MGPLPAVGFRGGSSDLKVAVRSQNREACDEPPPTPSVLGVGTLLSGHRKLCELLRCPSEGTLGLQTAPPRVVAHTVGHQQPVWGPRCCRDPCLAPRFLEEKPHQQLKWVSGGRDAVGPREEVMASLGGEDEPTEE